MLSLRGSLSSCEEHGHPLGHLEPPSEPWDEGWAPGSTCGWRLLGASPRRCASPGVAMGAPTLVPEKPTHMEHGPRLWGLSFLIYKLCVMVSLTSQGSWENPLRQRQKDDSRGRKYGSKQGHVCQRPLSHGQGKCEEGTGRGESTGLGPGRASVWAWASDIWPSLFCSRVTWGRASGRSLKHRA